MSSFAEINKDTSLAVGENGALYVSGGSAEGRFGAIQATEDAVFTAITASNWPVQSYNGLKLVAGACIFGAFTSFTLTSGKVLAYNA